MHLASTDFELFDIAPRYAIDPAALDARWRSLQAEVHPDRYAAEGGAAQRIAMQWAVRVNEAYRRLKDPVARASYLCEQHGAAIDAESNTAMPSGFLVRQMEWREALDDAGDDLPQVERLASEVAAHRAEAIAEIETTLDERNDYPAAAQQVRALMFVERFRADINRRLATLEE
jgi:molecular chaperone HscB